MADAVAEALATGQHLLVQAGTGTGKSLGYLAPALMRAAGASERVVVATATLALQAQLAKTDIPRALDAVEKVLGRRPRTAILKGRSNYACLLRVRDQAVEDQDTLLGSTEVVEAMRATAQSADSVVGAEVVALREWAETQADDHGLADRDDAPSHTAKAWAQVSVPVRECVGAQRCPYGEVCFVEKSREVARAADLVVTNHALLAIDAMHGGTALPEHDHVIIDEAHELVARVTGAASAELSPQQVERIAKRSLPWLSDELGLEFLEMGDVLREALDAAPLEQVPGPDAPVVRAFEQVRDVTRKVVSAMGGKEADNEERQAQAAVKEVFDVAERMAALGDFDVIYVAERDRMGREARVAPLSVAGLMREKVLNQVTTILTSATLRIGGDFESAAGSVGLRRDERRELPAPPAEDEELTWRGIDVGSPFHYAKQGILYISRSLPRPGRDGISDAVLAEVAELVWAAGGRTLGLFASTRSAEVAARHVRENLKKHTVLCQGDAQLSELTRRFIDEPETSLFGTMSLWQGIDVPGDTCRLVIIDKIPFPRPDDPLMQARQRAVAEAGGNGFMAVAAGHAALLLAQGAGRLIRRATDRGVVAVLDPRLSTARYGSFLRAGMPPMWQTNDPEIVVQALRRLSAET
ncbi:ATP-dependent DNA helicase [Granulicoccus sp. GXG6511]|uniref:ATP-dependent DNA helicase n=1 Tax=Granulicoccus sp. GXG6511 TaxID=3381351 RepID=UPI003D7D8491